MSRCSRTDERYWRWARGLLALAVGVSALALGGAHVRVVVVVALMIAVASLLAFKAGVVRELPPPAVAVAALGLYSLLQSIPLPISLLKKLSPKSADIWEHALAPFGQSLTFGSISLDPGASSLEGAKWLSYALCFTLAAAATRRHGPRWAATVVFISALVLALATLAHGLVGATRVFGLYEPTFGASRWHIAPILNPNCLAGYLNLGVFCGLGFTFAGRTSVPRSLYAVGVGVVLAVSVLSGSRGGFVALLVGLVAFVVTVIKIPFATERLRQLRSMDWLLLGSSILAGLTFAVLGASGSTIQELLQKDVAKLKLSGWVLPMLRDYPLTGIGRGAFESVFPEYRSSAGNLIYSHPENIVVQWLSEWGLLFGAGALLTLAWQLRPSQIALGRRVTTLGAAVGVSALILSNFVDLSLELMAPALAASLLLGGCWSTERPEATAARSPGRWHVWCRQLVLCWVPFLAVGLALWRGMRPVATDRAALRDSYAVINGDAQARTEFQSELRQAMLRHPGEAYFARLGALAALQSGTVDPMPWLNRALERCLTNGTTHLLLADALKARGALSQALLEARLSLDYDPTLASNVGRAVVRWTHSPDEIARAAPAGKLGAPMLLAAAMALNDKEDTPHRERVLRLAIERDPSLVAARRALANQLLAMLGDARCAPSTAANCREEILAQARALDALNPQNADGIEIMAQASLAMPQSSDVAGAIAQRCPSFDDLQRVRCLGATLAILRAGTDRGAVVQAAQQLVKSACSLDQECQRSLLVAAAASASAGDGGAALGFYERAARREPTPTLLLRVADTATALGRPSIAERALRLAAAKAGANGSLRGQIAKRREALIRNSLQ